MWGLRKNIQESDADLIAKYKKNGDKDVFALLFEKHVKVVYGACLYYFKNREEAQDETMNIFEKLITEILKRDIHNFKGWLSFVVRNHCISKLRALKRQVHFNENISSVHVENPNEDAFEHYKEEDYLDKINVNLTHLKPCQQTCIRLFYIENKSYSEISVITGYEIQQVKSYLQNGKRNLLQMITQTNTQK